MLHPPRTLGDSLMLRQVDVEVDRLWDSNSASAWVVAYLIADENAAGVDVASNAAHAYWRHRAPARPALVMLNEYSPGPERLAIGLQAVTFLPTKDDTLLLARLYCAALNEQYLLLSNRDAWWEPISNRYQRRALMLQDAISESEALLGEPAWNAGIKW